jgi:uncharacterized protein (DUF58 family)
MIVPTVRLIICYVLAVPLLTLMPILGIRHSGFILPVAAILIIAVIADCISARIRLRGIALSLAPVYRCVKDRRAVLDVHFRNEGMQPRAITLALSFPVSLKAETESLVVQLPRGQDTSAASVSYYPSLRGIFPMGAYSIGAISLLGLWQWRMKGSCPCEIHVYPGISHDRSLLAALFLNRSGVLIPRRPMHGKGKEFERLRDYMAGDGYEDIHWKTTAKRRHPVSKVYQMERTQEIYVIIDSSRLSGRTIPGGGEKQLDRFVTAGLLVGIAAMKQGDLFGLGAFSDSVHHFMGASGGKAHFNNCRRHIFSLEPETVNPDYSELFTFIRTRLRKRALLIVLTNLDDPVMAESFVQGVELVCRHHIVLAAMFRPERLRPLFQKRLTEEEDVYDALSSHRMWHNLREVRGILAKRGIDFTLLDHERFTIDLITRYMSVKERQRL